MTNPHPPRLRTVERIDDYIRGVTVTRQNWGTLNNADYYYTVDVHLGKLTVCVRSMPVTW